MRLLFGHVDEAALAEVSDAALAPERLSAGQRRHLDECDRCAVLVEGHRRATRLLSARWRLVPAAELTSGGAVALRPRIRAGGAIGPSDRGARAVWLPLAIVLAALVLALVVALLPAGSPRPPLTSTRITFAAGSPMTVMSVNVDGSGPYSWTANTTGTTETVGGIPRDRAPAWSPDGTRLAFSRKVDDAGREQIVVLAADLISEVRYLGRPDLYDSLAWSPDGRVLAASTANGIVVLDPASGSERTILALADRDGREDLLSWSPDGSSILAGTDVGDLVLVDVTSETVTTVVPRGDANVAYRASRAAWSPTGAKVAFFADPLVRDEISYADGRVMVANADGTEGLELAPGRYPTWSPDGSLIAFESDVPPHGIWVVRPDGTGIRSVGDGLRPSWSPDGRFIAYCGHADDVSGFFVAEAVGGPPRLVYEIGCRYDWGEYVSLRPTVE